MNVGTILDLVILGVLAVGALAWRSFGSGVEQAAKDQASEMINRINWTEVLGRDLEKTRGTERQEVRFASYGALWAAMRPLAIFDDTTIDREAMGKLAKALSDWYFSPTGGLLLTVHNRNLYFALQGIVNAAASGDDWTADRVDTPEDRFKEILTERHFTHALSMLGMLSDTSIADRWPEGLDAPAKGWRDDIRNLANDWAGLKPEDRFVVLQQTSSALRTGLANDVESRLR